MLESYSFELVRIHCEEIEMMERFLSDPMKLQDVRFPPLPVDEITVDVHGKKGQFKAFRSQRIIQMLQRLDWLRLFLR